MSMDPRHRFRRLEVPQRLDFRLVQVEAGWNMRARCAAQTNPVADDLDVHRVVQEPKEGLDWNPMPDEARDELGIH